jgi:hypothetical protein
MSERTAWILTFVFGATAVVATVVYVLALVNLGQLNLHLAGGMIALFLATGLFFRKASHLRTQRVVSQRADEIDETDEEAARKFYGE